MSLVFLKSDVQQEEGNRHKASRFSNYLTQPLHLEPNSQVALVNTKFNIQGGQQLSDTGTLEFRFGNPTLNMPIQLPLKDIYVTSWESECNTIARACNMLGLDDNFNHAYVDSNTVPTIGGVAPTDITPQDEYNAGTNFFYADGERKAYMRLVQRGVNQMFNQGFNTCGTNGNITYPTAGGGYGQIPAGINFGSGDNRIDFCDLTEYDVDNVASFTMAPTVYGNDAILRQPRFGGPSTGISTGANFYNTNYAASRLARSAIDYTRPLSDPPSPFNIAGTDNSEIAFNNYQTAIDSGVPAADWDRYWGYSMESSRCGIKQYVGNQALGAVPELNGGGHDLPSGLNTGGYNIYVQDSILYNDCDVYMPNTDVGGAVAGKVGLTASFFGVHSERFVHTAAGTNRTADNTLFSSRRIFMQNVDLNRSDDSSTPQHAWARYLFGVRTKWVGAVPNKRLIAQAEILDPEASLIYSEYRRVGPQLDITALCQGTNTAGSGGDGNPVNFGGSYDINVHGGPTTEAFLVWRFRWTSPYQMAIEFMLSVDGNINSYHLEKDEPYLPSGNNGDPTTGWVTLYNMNVNDNGRTGATYYFNNWHNGLIFVNYPTLGGDRQFNFNKGFYDTRLPNRLHQNNPTADLGIGEVINLTKLKDYSEMKYWSDEPINWYEDGGTIISYKDDTVPGETPQRLENFEQETFDSSGFAKKEIYWLVKPMKDLNDVDQWRSWFDYDIDQMAYDVTYPRDLNMGVEFGLVKETDASVLEWNNDIDGIGTPFTIYGWNGINKIMAGLASLSLHYQLTNLPILSQQGVKSTTDKTFYVVDTLCVAENHSGAAEEGWYCHEVPEKLFIDLNNAGPLDLNRLDILITDDDNKQLTNLRYDTSLVICFRQKPNNQGYSRFQGGTTNGGQRFDPSSPFFQRNAPM